MHNLMVAKSIYDYWWDEFEKLDYKKFQLLIPIEAG